MSEQHIVKNTLILSFTSILTRIMGFFYRIFLSRVLGAQGLGLYQLIFPVEVIILAFSSSGIQIAISRLCASYHALHNTTKEKNIFLSGTLLSFLLSIVMSGLCFIYAKELSLYFIKEPRTAPLIRLLVFSIPFTVLHGCIKSYYYSMKKTLFPALTLIIEQVVRIIICWILYQFLTIRQCSITPSIAIAGTIAGEMVAAVLSLLAVFFLFSNTEPASFKGRPFFHATLEIGRTALPLTLNKVLLHLLNSMEMLLIPQALLAYGLSPGKALATYGTFTGMAVPLILFPSTITIALSTMLVPSLAELSALGHIKRIRLAIQKSIYYCFFPGLICSFMFFFFGPSIGKLFFHNPEAGAYIKHLAFACPFLYLNNTLSGILSGLGKTQRALIHNVFAIILKILCIVILIPKYSITGYLYGILISEMLLSMLHLNFISFIIRC